MNNYKKHQKEIIKFFKRCWTYHLRWELYDLAEDIGLALRHMARAVLGVIVVAFILLTPILFLLTPLFTLLRMFIFWVKGRQ